MTQIIVKKFQPHYNRALDIPITSQRQYNDELKRRGLVSQEQGDDIALRAKHDNKQPFKPTDETMRYLHHVQSHAQKDGKVKLSGQEIVYMEKLGCKFGKVEYKGTEGGFK